MGKGGLVAVLPFAARPLPHRRRRRSPFSLPLFLLSRRHGLTVSLGFFDDIHIPSDLLLQPAKFSEAEREWYWEMDDSTPLFYTRGGDVRFKVHGVSYTPIPSLQAQTEQKKAGNAVLGSAEAPHVPMAVVGRADSNGLGMICWDWGDDD